VLEKLATINVAAVQYYAWLKEVPSSLKQLGPTDKAVADREAADLIPHGLAQGIAGGYRFTLVAAAKRGWIVTATAIESSNDGFKTVYKIETRVPDLNTRTHTKTGLRQKN
jgi:hypothetical protein